MLLTMMVVLHQGTYLATVLHCCCWLLHGCLGWWHGCLGWWQYQWSNQKHKWSLLAFGGLTQAHHGHAADGELCISALRRKKSAFISDCFIWTVMIFTDNGTSRNENRVLLLSGCWAKFTIVMREKCALKILARRRFFSENWVIVVTSWHVEVLLTPT